MKIIDITPFVWIMAAVLMAFAAHLEISFSPFYIKVNHPYTVFFFLFFLLAMLCFEQDVRQRVKEEQLELKEHEQERKNP